MAINAIRRRCIAVNGRQRAAVFHALSTATLKQPAAATPLEVSAGGGISTGTAKLTNCAVSGTSAAAGAGGIVATVMATLTNCTVSGNSGAAGAGGGIQATAATLTNCTVSGNMAGVAYGGGSAQNSPGGGIFVDTAATLTNSTVSGNTAAGSGGGVGGINGSTVTLTNSTVSGNTAGGGGMRTALADSVAKDPYCFRDTALVIGLVGGQRGATRPVQTQPHTMTFEVRSVGSWSQVGNDQSG